MSNYTIAVDWAGKNGLSDSNAAKVISGSDFNSEFTTVRTAINSKADTNGKSTESFALNNGTVAGTLTVTGVPTIPTPATDSNTTIAASTAMVQAAIDADVVVHAALRASQTVYGHAKMHVASGDLYIVTT